MGAWDKVKVAYRLWRTAVAASKALHRNPEAQRYVFMTGFDRGKLLASTKRTAYLNHAVEVLGLAHQIGLNNPILGLDCALTIQETPENARFAAHLKADAAQRKTVVPPGQKPEAVAPSQVWARWMPAATIRQREGAEWSVRHIRPGPPPVYLWVSSVHEGEVWGVFSEEIPALQRAGPDVYPMTSEKLLTDPAWHYIGIMPSEP